MFSPRMFGKYYLTERLAVGGMAEIYSAKMYGVDGFEKKMVVKQILPQYSRNKDFIQMFIDEAKIAVSLSHGNIVPVFELGQIEDVYFIAMEQVEGKTLGELLDAAIENNVELSIEHALFVCSEILSGLDYAHRKTDEQGTPLNIVHRDVSPQNILISYEGDVKIVDFGIARAATKVHETQSGVIKGKFGYMSPEQAMGNAVDSRSDIFAAGILLYEMLTLERLFQGSTDAMTLDRVKRADVPTPSRVNKNLPPQLDAILFKALDRDPALRYQTCGEMRLEVSRLLYAMKEEASAQTLSAMMKSLFASELEKRRAQPPSNPSLPVLPIEQLQPPASPPPAGNVAHPQELFDPSLQPAASRRIGAYADQADLAHAEDDLDGDLEDDFSYIKSGRRIKALIVLVVLGSLVLGGILFADDIARVFGTLSDVIDESAQRLAQKQLGTLYVRSRPSGAKVYFSNLKQGSTNVRLGNIDPTKEYELVLTLEGFRPWSRMIRPSDWRLSGDKMTIQVFVDFAAEGLK